METFTNELRFFAKIFRVYATYSTLLYIIEVPLILTCAELFVNDPYGVNIWNIVV